VQPVSDSDGEAADIRTIWTPRNGAPNRYLLVLALADLTAAVVSLGLATWLRQVVPYGRPFAPEYGGPSLNVFLLVLFIWAIIFRLLSAYDPNHILRFAEEVRTVWGAVVLSTFILAGALYLSYRELSRVLFVYFFLMEMIASVLLRLAVRALFRALKIARTSEQRILLVGAGEVGCQMAMLLAERSWMGLQVVGFLDDDPDKAGQRIAGCPVVGSVEQAPELVRLHRIREVIITLPLHAHQRLAKLVSALNDMPVNVRIVPDFFPLAYLRTSIGILGDMPLVTLKEPVLDGFELLAKRTLDLSIAMPSLLLLWPVMLIVALLIKLDSAGPVLFKQQRVGMHGRLFCIYKFRTMRVGAEKDIELVMDRTPEGKRLMRKDRPDPRVTRIGRRLRRWSLDELPQLFNVLKGDMSIVGPRPELPLLAAQYEPWQRKRLSVPPGITGWWQVTARADKPLAVNTEADLYYVRNYSLVFDLQILLRTISAVIKGKGAY
jgi:exopolysaccharide biosynthesis polyprenyl glycosylphosphotransferase